MVDLLHCSGKNRNVSSIGRHHGLKYGNPLQDIDLRPFVHGDIIFLYEYRSSKLKEHEKKLRSVSPTCQLSSHDLLANRLVVLQPSKLAYPPREPKHDAT